MWHTLPAPFLSRHALSHQHLLQVLPLISPPTAFHSQLGALALLRSKLGGPTRYRAREGRTRCVEKSGEGAAATWLQDPGCTALPRCPQYAASFFFSYLLEVNRLRPSDQAAVGFLVANALPTRPLSPVNQILEGGS